MSLIKLAAKGDRLAFALAKLESASKNMMTAQTQHSTLPELRAINKLNLVRQNRAFDIHNNIGNRWSTANLNAKNAKLVDSKIKGMVGSEKFRDPF